MSASIQPSTPARAPILGKLTMAHLRPRAAPVVEVPDVLKSRDGAGQRTFAPPKGRDRGQPDAVPQYPEPNTPNPPKRSAAAAGKRRAGTRSIPGDHVRTAFDDLQKRFHRHAITLWPAAFPTRNRKSGRLGVPPLALGSRPLIEAAMHGHFTPEEIKACMRGWTTRIPYLNGVVRHFEQGLPRINLDGTPSADMVTEHEVRRARGMIASKLRDWAERAKVVAPQGKGKMKQG